MNEGDAKRKSDLSMCLSTSYGFSRHKVVEMLRPKSSRQTRAAQHPSCLESAQVGPKLRASKLTPALQLQPPAPRVHIGGRLSAASAG
jgi:hypothetical protein